MVFLEFCREKAILVSVSKGSTDCRLFNLDCSLLGGKLFNNNFFLKKIVFFFLVKLPHILFVTLFILSFNIYRVEFETMYKFGRWFCQRQESFTFKKIVLIRRWILILSHEFKSIVELELSCDWMFRWLCYHSTLRQKHPYLNNLPNSILSVRSLSSKNKSFFPKLYRSTQYR